MKIKEGLEIYPTDFWFNLSKNGYLNPYEICENIEDAHKVAAAVRVIKDFDESCHAQIKDFDIRK